MTTSMIELLENRIAPAAIFVSALMGAYTDEDGDTVFVRFSKPILTASNVATVLPTTAAGAGNHLDKIVLAGIAGASGTDITVTARVSGNGDGLMNIGTIDATGIDLGIVNVHGDLGNILAGNTATDTAGLKSLTVVSMGMAATFAGGSPAGSVVRGALGSLIVATDFAGANLSVEAAAVVDAKIGTVFVGGSVLSGGITLGGNIIADGNIGAIIIRGSVLGGKATSALIGSISGSIGTLSISGSLFGGSEASSGLISAASIGSVKVGHNIVGGAGLQSGAITAQTRLGSLTVGGSVYGGGGESSGRISSAGIMGNVTIGANVQGGGGEFSGNIDSISGMGTVTIGGSLTGGSKSSTGGIVSGGNIGAVTIGGSLSGGGSDASIVDSGEIRSYGGSIARVIIYGNAVSAFGAFNGCIIAERNLGPVIIGGDITSYGDAFFIIRAKGLATGNAIAALNVGGSVNSASVLAGFGTGNSPVNGNASIGPVKVGGNWLGSSITAGVNNTNAPFFGDANDSIIAGSTLVSKIASITIGGVVRGTVGGTDHYGFVAQQIGSVTIAGSVIPLTAGAHSDNRSLGLDGDFRIHEV